MVEKKVLKIIDENENDIMKGIITDLKEVSNTFISLKCGFENMLTSMSGLLISSKEKKNKVAQQNLILMLAKMFPVFITVHVWKIW